jgi:hypothetical protein
MPDGDAARTRDQIVISKYHDLNHKSLDSGERQCESSELEMVI